MQFVPRGKNWFLTEDISLPDILLPFPRGTIFGTCL
jgi:hypothetical protein